MKDLILVSAYCNTKEKEDILRNLVNQIHQENKYDILLISHTVIPEDISNKCTLSVYDSKNELLYDWDLRCRPWFNPNDDRKIQSIFTGNFNTHLAIWRMVILGNSIAKNLGYQKVHHIEYDCDIKDFTEINNNSELLDEYDCITYVKKITDVDPVLFGTYQAYRLDNIHEDLLIFNPEKIKNKIRQEDIKLPERMLFELLHNNKKGLIKQKSLLDTNNFFGLSNAKHRDIAWCLPYYDRLTNELGFVVWNKEPSLEVEDNTLEINVKLIYNNSQVFDFGNIPKLHWVLKTIDNFDNAKNLVVLLNNQIRNIFDFEKDGEMFKQVSFREEFNKI
jgi:hypothetical protein